MIEGRWVGLPRDASNGRSSTNGAVQGQAVVISQIRVGISVEESRNATTPNLGLTLCSQGIWDFDNRIRDSYISVSNSAKDLYRGSATEDDCS